MVRVDMDRAKKANRVLWNLFCIFLLLSLLSICFFYVLLIRKVEFVGGDRYDDDELIQMSGLIYKDSILFVDDKKVTAGLEASPYIKVEDIEIKLPSTVRITISERGGAALTKQAGNTMLIDPDGILLDIDGRALEELLPEVSGWNILSSTLGGALELEQPLQLSAYTSIVNGLKTAGLDQSVRSIDVTNVLLLSMVMRDGTTVRLGDADRIQDKISWLTDVYRDVLASGRAGGTIDVSSGTSATYADPE